MKKWFISLGLLVAMTGAGSAYALFQGSGPTPSATLTPILRSADVETAVETGKQADATAFSRCGSASGGCGSKAGGGNCCGGPPSGSEAARQNIDRIQAYLQRFYTDKLGAGITVQVNDLGCHQEAEIRQADRIIKKLSISGGTITDIT